MSFLMPMELEALVAKFHNVTAERIKRLRDALVIIESDPENSEAHSSLLHEIHTLKGEAMMMGFVQVATVARCTEELIFQARDLGYCISKELAELIFTGLGLIAVLMNDDNGGNKGNVESFVAKTEKLLSK